MQLGQEKVLMPNYPCFRSWPSQQSPNLPCMRGWGEEGDWYWDYLYLSILLVSPANCWFKAELDRQGQFWYLAISERDLNRCGCLSLYVPFLFIPCLVWQRHIICWKCIGSTNMLLSVASGIKCNISQYGAGPKASAKVLGEVWCTNTNVSSPWPTKGRPTENSLSMKL